ncbi:rho guanine nucleotide exchange factor TIAM2-like isoform X2 [Antennarius striatus]|uniref:rho guanine nucleotide exchange factor TIAM2-like isoform X2 n=1 Tax=Antennarius striatus TaxID=241820 RepID=UPI0035B2CA8D
MKKMAELQLSVIKDPPSRRAVETQIRQWEQNLEQLHLDLFRLRCYLASLQGGEPPNPKSLLAVAGRPSKCMLGRLGVFSASSFHALVCSRDGGALRGRTLPVGRLRRRGLSASLKTLGGASGRSKNRRNSSQGLACVSNQREAPPPSGRPVQVRSLTPGDPSDSLLTPPLRVLSLHLRRTDAATDFGFAVTGHLDGGGRSHIYVSEVNPLGPSAKEGLRAGDEVLAVNGSFLSGLDLDLMESVFSLQKLQLVLRRDGRGDPDDPAHPKDPGQFPVPADLQTWTRSSDDHVPSGSFENLQENVDHAHSLFQIFPATDPNLPRNPYCGEAGLQPSSPAHLSVCQRLRKVIQELLDTERSYVKDLVLLLDVYLTPLREETFLTREEMEALFGSLPELLDFQRLFLQTLERGVAAGPDPVAMEMPGQFQLLFSLGGAFLHYADHFKHYSGFCTNHVKVQKVLERAKTDAAFKRFLDARNPTNQHSASLESFLIKPVQRVLRYPLLLRQLVALTAPGTPEHGHLTEALRAMEEVATHINDTQKIYEDYGTVLDQLAAEQGGACRQAPPPAGQARPPPQVTEISMGDFLVQSSVVWLNPLPCLGRLRRDPELTLFVFKRAVVLVYRDSARMRRRTNGPRSADLDPFRFRWLIPVSEVQVRPAPLTGPVDPSVWELIHIRSEVEGRPEMLFQLCSSGLEMKASVLGALRSVLRPRPQSSPLRRSNNRALTAGRRSRLPEERGGANGETCSEPLLPSHAPSDHSGRRSRLCSLTSELEAQLQRMSFTEGAELGGGEEERRGSIPRRPIGHDLLEGDFSVQSLSSMINEDCFYDARRAGP